MFKPETGEYGDYYETYVSLVTEDDIRGAYAAQPVKLRALVEGIDELAGSFRYAKDKWSIKEVISHLIDGERIFSYRMLRISRGDKTPIEGFEQDGYIENSRANERKFSDLLDEFELVRKANTLMLNNFDSAALAAHWNGKWVSGFGSCPCKHLYRPREAPFVDPEGKILTKAELALGYRHFLRSAKAMQ